MLELREGPLHQKRRGEVDGDGDSGSEAGSRGDSLGFQQLTSPSHPFSRMVPWTRREQSTWTMCSASLMNPFVQSAHCHEVDGPRHAMQHTTIQELVQHSCTQTPLAPNTQRHLCGLSKLHFSVQVVVKRLRGAPNASERGTKSEAAHKWALWLPHPCCQGGSPTLQSRGQNQRVIFKNLNWLIFFFAIGCVSKRA